MDRSANDQYSRNAQNEQMRMGAAQGYQNAFDQNQRAGLQAAALAPSIYDLQYQPGRQLMNAGQIREGYAGQQLNDAINRWNFIHDAPWGLLSQYNALLQPLASTGGTVTSTGQSQSGGLRGAIGGAMMGGAYGGVPGAVLGGIGGLF